jgi:iron complex transport system substrate-binding protein
MRFFHLILTATLFLCSCRHGGKAEDLAQLRDTGGAVRFAIEKEEGFTKITVKDPWQNSHGAELEYYLLPHDAMIPEGVSPDRIIRTPVRRMICMSATHIAMLRALGVTDILVGISGSGLVYDSLVLDGIRRGTIRDVGYDGNLNHELIVSLNPDVLIAYSVAVPSAGRMEKLASAGIKVVYDADYLEEHPLARCEWIRVFGLLTGKEEAADSILAVVSENYRETVRMVRNNIADRPVVLLGSPWEDVWYVSPSNTYTGRLIEDAGGNYLFRDLKGPHSVPFSVESVYRRAVEADLWINPGSAGNLGEIAASDHRMTMLPVYKQGRVWNNRKRVTPEGGNDYWESAVVRPDLLLKDFVSIIHPELMPDYQQYYYSKLQ